MEMEETNGLRQAQVQRDNFVPDVPEGKGEWCPQCGAWRPGPVCGACRRRESVLAVLWPQREGVFSLVVWELPEPGGDFRGGVSGPAKAVFAGGQPSGPAGPGTGGAGICPGAGMGMGGGV